MIRVDKDYVAIPEGLASAGAEGCRDKALKEKGGHDFKGAYYDHATVREKLKEIYKGKCAYCETPMEPASSGRVEHYRPKARVAEDKSHPGYYWLGYEWSNLLWSCERCNGKKLDKFPVVGTRVTTHPANRSAWRLDDPAMVGEQALLLNPERDQPEKHLRFLPDGRIEAINGSRRGEETIRLCGLDREELSLVRKRKVDELGHALHKQLEELIDQQKKGQIGNSAEELSSQMRLAFLQLFQRLELSGTAEQPYAQLGRQMFMEFETFYLAGLADGEPRRLLATAWKLFLLRWRET